MPNFLVFGVYAVAFGALPAFIFGLVGGLSSWRRPVTSIAAGVLTVTGLAITVSELPDPAISSIQIDEKGAPQVVEGAWPTIEGSVVPPEARVILLVHWVHDNKWWIQDSVKRGSLGAWQANINLGTRQKGAREQFQVVALASTNPWIIDVLRGYWLWDGMTVARPPSLPRSEVLTMWRSQ